MQRIKNFPWARILGDGVLIIVSILLAFAIDAWWEGREERALEHALLLDLHRDFQASQEHLDIWLEGNRRMLGATQTMLHRVQATSDGQVLEARPEWIIAAVGTPTYSPTDATLNATLASGRLDLLGDTELRKALASWRQQVDDTREDEQLLRELVAFTLVPILADQIRIAPAFEFDAHIGWFTGNTELRTQATQILKVTLPLEAAISQRVFYQRFVIDGLETLHETQARVLKLTQLKVKP